MSHAKNPIQARIEAERALSPVRDLSPQKIAHIVGINARDNSVHESAGRKRSADPQWKAAQKQGMEELRNDPERWAEYQANYSERNKDKYDNPEYWQNYYEGIQRRDSDVEYTKERLARSRKRIRKPVQTPLGVFETQTDAAQAHGFSNTEIIRYRIKSDRFPDYQSITIEQYEEFCNH
jgi:hypothetical protein